MASEIVNNVSRWGGGDFCVDNFEIDWLMGYLDSDQENKKKMIDNDVGNNNLEKRKTSNSESLCACDLDIDSIMGYLDSDQENKKKMRDSDAGNNNLEKSRTSNSESLSACDLDIDSIMGYLDFDQENSNLEGTGYLIDSVFNLEESRTSTRGSFIVMDDSGVADCSAAHQCEIGGFCFDDLCSDDFDINWFVRCLDSDKQEEPLKDNTVNKVVRRKFAIGDQKLDELGGGLCLDDLSGGDLCFNDHLDGKDFCSDDFDIDLFMRCLDSDKEDEAVKDNNTLDSDKEDEPVKDNAISKVVRRKFKISNQELDEFDGVFCLDDLCVGDLCVDEDSDFGIDWFVRCLDSDQKEDPVKDDQLERREYEAELGGDFCCDDLSGFNIDWFMQILDSNQEEPVEHRTSSNLGKRKFEAEVNQTGPKRRVVSNY